MTQALFAKKCDSVASQSDGEKKNSTATCSTSKSKGKEGRLLLRDYLYLTNKNSQRSREAISSKDKNELRKVKYKLD